MPPPPHVQTQSAKPPYFPVDIANLQTVSGVPVSDFTKDKISRCLEYIYNAENPDNSADGVSENGSNAPGNRFLRRRVKRVGWEVLKNWEIWALDAQEI